MIRLTVLSVSVALFSVTACNSAPEPTDAPAKPLAAISSTDDAGTGREAQRAARPAKVVPTEPSQRSEPRSEEALVEAVARALSARRLPDLQTRTTVEFAADLRRMHDLDPATFWIRGSAFVQNVKSGFEVLHRQEDTSDQWNIVVRFGNGQEERMTFTRDGGKLRFVDL
jgi:hypothetical protein